MIVVYRKNTGEIVQTIDYEQVTPEFERFLPEDLAAISTLVENPNCIRTMRVDLETKTLVSKAAIIFTVDKREVYVGEPIAITFRYEGPQFGDTFPVMVGPGTVLNVPYGEPQITVTFELPDEYVLSIPDLRIYHHAVQITVREKPL